MQARRPRAASMPRRIAARRAGSRSATERASKLMARRRSRRPGIASICRRSRARRRRGRRADIRAPPQAPPAGPKVAPGSLSSRSTPGPKSGYPSAPASASGRAEGRTGVRPSFQPNFDPLHGVVQTAAMVADLAEPGGARRSSRRPWIARICRQDRRRRADSERARRRLRSGRTSHRGPPLAPSRTRSAPWRRPNSRNGGRSRGTGGCEAVLAAAGDREHLPAISRASAGKIEGVEPMPERARRRLRWGRTSPGSWSAPQSSPNSIRSMSSSE